MFGPVPRVVWEKKVTPDDRHRLLMETNCLLVETGSERILIDTGYGSKADARQRDFQGLEEGNPIVRNLDQLGYRPRDITMVLLTHLHFDHAGGCTQPQEGGGLVPVFPRARHLVQRAEWDDAIADRAELAGSYFRQDFEPVADAGLMEWIDGPTDVAPGIRVRPVPGHTRGMQIVEIGASAEGGTPAGVMLADLVPSSLHLKTFWHVAYDQFPLEVRRQKPLLLGEAVDAGACVFFCHDSAVPGAYLKRDAKQEFEIDRRLAVGETHT
jgi:glyoxylase-like metal-dependent hydrolase (beta-lactamase superfamily II)